MEELIEKYKDFLERCQMHNIKLSKQKLQVGMMVIFASVLIGSGDGSYKPALAKAEAINELTHPTTVTEVGLLNSFKNFIPDFTQLLPNIRGLLKKDTVFQWLE